MSNSMMMSRKVKDGKYYIKQKNQKRDNFKSQIKKSKSNKKRNRPKLVVFGTTILLMLITLFVYLISLIIAPPIELKARIEVVSNGYNLVYNICEIPNNNYDLEVGESVYITQQMTLSKTSRKSIPMKVRDINEKTVFLDFNIDRVPTFMSNEDMQAFMKTNAESNKLHISEITIVGKIVGNSFIVQSIK